MPDRNLVPAGSAGPLFAEPDPCAGRHGGNQASAEAWKRAAPHAGSMKARILEMFRQAGREGLTSARIERILGVGKNKWSGRLTSLEQDGWIVDSKRMDEGCRVLVHRDVVWGSG